MGQSRQISGKELPHDFRIFQKKVCIENNSSFEKLLKIAFTNLEMFRHHIYKYTGTFSRRFLKVFKFYNFFRPSRKTFGVEKNSSPTRTFLKKKMKTDSNNQYNGPRERQWRTTDLRTLM